MSGTDGEDRYWAIRFPARIWGAVLTLDPGRDGVRLSSLGRAIIAVAAILTLVLLAAVPALPSLLSLE